MTVGQGKINKMEENCTQKEESLDDNFYKKAEEYWKSIDPTINGVLGGFGYISTSDIQGSSQFLKSILVSGKADFPLVDKMIGKAKTNLGLVLYKVKIELKSILIFIQKDPDSPAKTRALDCGAGVGRVTLDLLIHHFKAIDLIEQDVKFLEEAKRNLSKTHHIGNFYHCGIQNFEAKEKYDVIWCQWVLGHLKDDDLVVFFCRCRNALQQNGMIVVKENISSSESALMDETDSSLTRPVKQYVSIFRRAGLRITKQAKQSNFPKRLFVVKMFSLVPIEPTPNNEGNAVE